ncbi:alcohol dehydrogenase catalytic domain-containing protein [Saxibacter everestensis]|uniref:Alcohol dehydrogenase catalytic domain-containing protein n=1 Tax=Saxibacter everestensis TaxID=2909229 RepID=A0ABY8QVK7_9MICO|nr:alcohol dehydrogenase catalytic domain-containing protein [Brevibacteriaceae bacterium ZFBP1038]
MKITGAVLEEMSRPRPYAESKPISISELELAEPGPHEILVRIEAAGVCHSDLSVVDGNRPRPLPMLLGHEAAGIVEQVGSDVSDIEVGQRVVMTFLPRCGECDACATNGRMPCTPGSATNGAGTLLDGERRLSRDGDPIEHHVGVSGFATHAVVDRRSVVPVDNDVPPEVAAVLGCAVLTGGGAIINAAKPEPGEAIMVVGLGGVGMAALLTALSLDGEDAEPRREVIAVDGVADKLRQARDLGATQVYSPQQLAERAEAGDPVKAPIVIEAAGNARAFESAVAATAPGGRTVSVGLPSPKATSTISPLGIVAEARTIVGSYLGSAVPSRDIPRFAELWRSGRLPVEKLVSSRVPLAEINTAMDELADGHAVRQIITF